MKALGAVWDIVREFYRFLGLCAAATVLLLGTIWLAAIVGAVLGFW